MIHTSTTWDGAVMIERPNPSTGSRIPQGMVLARSAISGALGGRRAIATHLPESMVRHYFRSQDMDHVFVRAELKNQHLQLGERCSLHEWAYTAHAAPTHN